MAPNVLGALTKHDQIETAKRVVQKQERVSGLEGEGRSHGVLRLQRLSLRCPVRQPQMHLQLSKVVCESGLSQRSQPTYEQSHQTEREAPMTVRVCQSTTKVVRRREARRRTELHRHSLQSAGHEDPTLTRRQRRVRIANNHVELSQQLQRRLHLMRMEEPDRRARLRVG